MYYAMRQWKSKKAILLNNFILRFYLVTPPISHFDFGYSFLLPALLAA